MPANLLLSPSSRRQLDLFLNKPSHAVLIYGPPGSGKSHLARHLAALLLGAELNKLVNHPYYSELEKPADKTEISIDAVREIIRQTKLKPVIGSAGAVRRAVVINGAHFLSIEAQNALLKIMEEPSDSTVFILTATSPDSVLPTIASRSQRLAVSPVSLEDAISHFNESHADKKITSSWQLSQGASGLLHALLADDNQHPLKLKVDDAKAFLRLGSYERLLFLDKSASAREEMLLFLDALERVLAALQRANIAKGDKKQISKLTASRKFIYKIQKALANNASPRLAAMSLALELPLR